MNIVRLRKRRRKAHARRFLGLSFRVVVVPRHTTPFEFFRLFSFSFTYLVRTRMPRLSDDPQSEGPRQDFPRCGQDQQIAETVVPSRPSQPKNRRRNGAARKHEKIGGAHSTDWQRSSRTARNEAYRQTGVCRIRRQAAGHLAGHDLVHGRDLCRFSAAGRSVHPYHASATSEPGTHGRKHRGRRTEELRYRLALLGRLRAL